MPCIDTGRHREAPSPNDRQAGSYYPDESQTGYGTGWRQIAKLIEEKKRGGATYYPGEP